MICNLSINQILIIIIGIILILFIIGWFINNKKKKKMQVNSKSSISADQNSQTINSSVPIFDNSDNPYVLNYFNNPGCPHCKNFDQTWKTTEQLLKQNGYHNITFRDIDITKPENENLIFYYNINKVPTTILITPNQNIEYTGTRDFTSLYNYVVSNVTKQ